MRRGDIVTVAASGDYGKPRPAVGQLNDSEIAALNRMLALVIGLA